MTQQFDVIVIGLGGMGSATVYQLAQRGQQVLGLEQFTPPHDRGSSHGKSRIIRQAYFEHPDYVPLILRAYDLWHQLEQETGQPLLQITGGLMLGSPSSDIVQGSLRSAQRYGLAHDVLESTAIRQRFPPLQPDPDTVAFYEPQAGWIHPERAIQAYLQQAAQLGADLRFEQKVLDWSSQADGVEVITASGRYHADRLVIAPGAWAAPLFKLHLPLQVERQVMYWFEPVSQLEQFCSNCLPIYVWETQMGTPFYGFPASANPNEGVKVAFFQAAPAHPCTPETLDRVVHPQEIDQMRACLKRYVPNLNGRLIQAVTCMYTTTPDEHFILGRHPHYPQVTIASPCSGHGFKFASVIGEVLADFVMEQPSHLPLSLFQPERFKTGLAAASPF